MKYSVWFSFLVVLAAAVLFQSGEQVQAGGPGNVVNNSDIFHWRVQWSQPVSGTNDRRTDWFLSSFFTETIMFQTSLLTATVQLGPTELVVSQEGVSGVSIGGLQDPNLPWSVGFGVKGMPINVAESRWARDTCASGPEFFAEIHEYPNSNDSWIRLLVHNTTGQRLELLVIQTQYTAGREGEVFTPIVPEGWHVIEDRVSASGWGGVLLSVGALNALKQCAMFIWNFPPMQNLDLTTPVPTITYPLTVTLSSGWNLVAAPSTGSKTAADLLSEIDSTSVQPKQMARWKDGRWESYVWGFPANNFPVEPGRGYFVRVEQGGVWTPGRHVSSVEKKN